MYDIACYGDESGDCLSGAQACTAGDTTCLGAAICAYDTDSTCQDYVNCAYDNTCVGGILCDSSDTTCQDDVDNWNSTGDRRLRAGKASTTTTPTWPFVSSIFLYGYDYTGSSYPTFCYHTHLYDFEFDNIATSDSSDDESDLYVSFYSMGGFPGSCSDPSDDATGTSDETNWEAGDKIATSGNEFAWTCGYYVEYEWDGNGDVYFEINSNNAIYRAASAIGLLAIGALLI